MTMIKEAVLWILIIAGIAVNLAFQDSLAGEAEESWELEQLHEPSPALLKREDAGRITIYDGLYMNEIDKAMDEQFDRIGSMMFIRTKHVEEDGMLYEDSDCD